MGILDFFPVPCMLGNLGKWETNRQKDSFPRPKKVGLISQGFGKLEFPICIYRSETHRMLNNFLTAYAAQKTRRGYHDQPPYQEGQETHSGLSDHPPVSWLAEDAPPVFPPRLSPLATVKSPMRRTDIHPLTKPMCAGSCQVPRVREPGQYQVALFACITAMHSVLRKVNHAVAGVRVLKDILLEPRELLGQHYYMCLNGAITKPPIPEKNFLSHDSCFQLCLYDPPRGCRYG